MVKFNFKKLLPVVLSGAFFFVSSINNYAEAKTRLKCAVVAPKGSTWMNILEEWDKDLKAKTKGEISFKFYSSGSMGDEKQVLRKIRSGQLDAAAFTGVGLGEIVPEVRLMELPFMFDNAGQVDYVLDNMDDFYNKKFQEKGFKNLGWAETGFVYIFTNKPIKNLEDFKGVKMWMWEGDELVQEIFKDLNLVPTPLNLTDVLTSLQTGLIDGVYGPPVGALALQWTTKVKYMVSQKMGYATGAILVSKKAYDALDPANRKILDDTAKVYSQKLIKSVRSDNERAKNSIRASGIVFTNASAATVNTMKSVSAKVADGLVGKLYSRDLLQKVRSLKAKAK
jgi:TRAP-type C4-dicarboxylate transport system substrate-binding protein